MAEEYDLYRHAAEYHLNMAEDALKYKRYEYADRHLKFAHECIMKRFEIEKN